ncbi:MAG: MFS transporter [Promethearchaeota archaeon]
MSETRDFFKESVLNKKEKISFYIVNIGNIPIMTLISLFLLIFYTDVVGLNPIAIGIMFLITRIFDGLNDPLIGFLIDHLPRTKWGKFRPYLLLGSIICSLNYVLLWLGPSLIPTDKLLIAYISYFLLSITFDLMDIPLNSMIPVMTETGKDRNTLSLIKSLGYVSGQILFATISIPIVLSFPTPKEGYHFLIIFAAIFVISCNLIEIPGIKERIEPIKKERYRVRDIFKILSAKPVLVHFFFNLFCSIGSGTSTAMVIYFWTYFVGRPELMSLVPLFMIMGMIIGMIIGTPILNRFGKKYTLVVSGFTLNLPSIAILFIDPSKISLFFLIGAISAIGGGINGLMGYGLQANNTDYVEWKQGHRAEGQIASLISFIQKTGLGIGAAIPGFILGLTGYVPNVEQTLLAIQGIYFSYIIFPVILGIIATFIIWIFYPLTKDINIKIAQELDQRRKQASALPTPSSH